MAATHTLAEFVVFGQFFADQQTVGDLQRAGRIFNVLVQATHTPAEFVTFDQFFTDEQTAGKFKDELDISCQTDCDEGHVSTTHQVNILEQIKVPQALISFLIPLMIAKRMLVIYSRFYLALWPRQGLKGAGRELLHE